MVAGMPTGLFKVDTVPQDRQGGGDGGGREGAGAEYEGGVHVPRVTLLRQGHVGVNVAGAGGAEQHQDGMRGEGKETTSDAGEVTQAPGHA